MASLSGKTAFVTGGSRGIGAAIVRRLVAEGADVAFTYEHSVASAEALAEELRGSGRRVLCVRASSADAGALESAIDAAAKTLDGLDILVNNAGIYRAGALEDLTIEDIDATLAVNVRAVILASRAAAAHMRGGGRIISIGSNLADRVPGPGMSLYAASKAALIGWTKGLARDLGPRGITVNIVHPGSTDTDMNPAEGPYAEAQRARMAIAQFGKPEDVAALVAFLAGPQGNSITGAGFHIDGGANA